MYAANAQSLLNLIRTIPALSAKTGLALGGRGGDAGLADVPVPYCWVLFAGDENLDSKKEGTVAMVPTLLLRYVVLVGVPYNSESDLLTTEYPLLKQVWQTINGQQTPSGSKWRYTGTRPPAINPDRLIFTQVFTTIASQ